jgi:hypothetical protein
MIDAVAGELADFVQRFVPVSGDEQGKPCIWFLDDLSPECIFQKKAPLCQARNAS